MSHREEGWNWILAVDFFFAGMGGAMLVLAGIVDLFVTGGQTSLLGNFLGPVFMSVGSGILIFDLGRPFQAWRVFMNPKAILTVGARVMTVSIIAGLAYTSFGIACLPWSGMIIVRKILAVFCIVTGLVVAIYPAFVLGRNKGRPFWSGSGMLSLFLLSSFATGASAHILSGLILPPASMAALAVFPAVTGVLLACQMLFWIGYIWVKRSGATAPEAVAAEQWISGRFSGSFKGGFLLGGTLIPMALVLVPSALTQAAGALLTLAGGLLMRILVVYAGEERTWLPGEKRYRSRLPGGDEAFLKAWNDK